MSEKPELPTLMFASAGAWEWWLEENHDKSGGGIWLMFARKASGIESVTYAEAVDGALCYGWIDGQTRSFDDRYWLQRYTPRRPGSKWSKVNRRNVARLTGEGRMRPVGLREVERAKNDGRWDAAYDSPRTATVPDDLQRELDGDPAAAKAFAALGRSRRYEILYALQDAKKPETRARRIRKYPDLLRDGK
nr:YdeI/OmpD-associated family protein [Rubrobacter indicoceani]